MNEAPLRVTVVGSGDAVATGGKRQTCFYIQTSLGAMLMDCGPASLAGIQSLNLSLDDLNAVLLTHSHGDHCGGIPFLLLAMHELRRTKPFWLLGPTHLENHLWQLTELCYPGLWAKLSFSLTFLPLSTATRVIDSVGLHITPFAMRHQPDALCLGYRIALPGGTAVAYSGDTMWNENLPPLAAQTQVFFCECSLWEPQGEHIRHLSYQELQTHRSKLATQRLILTHLSSSAWACLDQITEEIAFDGMSLCL